VTITINRGLLYIKNPNSDFKNFNNRVFKLLPSEPRFWVNILSGEIAPPFPAAHAASATPAFAATPLLIELFALVVAFNRIKFASKATGRRWTEVPVQWSLLPVDGCG